MRHHDDDSLLAEAIKDNAKERWSIYLYTAAVPLAFVSSWIAFTIYVVVAIMWLVPDSRI
jgi:hypothetical protein